MNSKNDLSDFEADLWLDLLVEDQLTAGQRKQVFQFCEQSPRYWKKMAVAFCDQQALRSALVNRIPASDGPSCLKQTDQWKGSEPVNGSGQVEGEKDVLVQHFERTDCPVSETTLDPKTDQSRDRKRSYKEKSQVFQRNRSLWISLAASFLFFCVGWASGGWYSQPASGTNVTKVDSESPFMTSVSYRLNDPVLDALERNNLVFENQVARQELDRIQKYLKENPALFQVKNSETMAIYHSEHRLPDFLIQALVFAGHRIHISQAFVDVLLPDGTTIGHPVHSYKIEKFALTKEVNLLRKGI